MSSRIRWSDWFARRRRVRVTRSGVLFLLLSFGIGLGAFNSGNNLLYMVLSALLSMILVSGLGAELTLRGIKVSRRPPPRIFAGEETQVSLLVRNEKTTQGAFSLSLVECFTRGRSLEPVSVPPIPPEGEVEVSYRCVFPRRGRCRFQGWRVETRFPFGIFSRSFELDAPQQAIIFPRIDIPLSLGDVMGGYEEEGAARRGAGEEFFSLRELREGEDQRRVAWRLSAHRQRLLTRETSFGANPRVEILVLNLGRMPRDPALEHLIDVAASLCARALAVELEVGLRTLDLHIEPSNLPGQLERLLSALALLRQYPLEEGAKMMDGLPPSEGALRLVLETEGMSGLTDSIEGARIPVPMREGGE